MNFSQGYPIWDAMAGRAPASAMSEEEKLLRDIEAMKSQQPTAPVTGPMPAPVKQQAPVAKPKPAAPVALSKAAAAVQAPPRTPVLDIDPNGESSINQNSFNDLLTRQLMQSASFKSADTDYTQKVRPSLVSEQDQTALFNALNELPLTSRKQQQDMLEKTQAALNQYAAIPVQTDLSPIMSLVDSWYGTKLSQGYNKPESASDRAVNLTKLQDAIAKQSNQLTEADLNLAKQLMGGQDIVRNVAQNTQQVASETPKPERPRGSGAGRDVDRFIDKLRDNLDKNITQIINKRNEEFANIDQAFGTNDYQTIMSIMANFARGVSGEKGVLTDQDILRVMPKSFAGDVAKFKAYFSETPTAQMNPEYVKSLKQAVQLAKQNAYRLYENLLNTKEQTFKADRRWDMSGGAAQATVNAVREGIKGYKPEAATPAANTAAPATPANNGILTPEEFFKNRGKK